MNTRSVRVIEKIVSYQGEGSDTGKRMLILRFKKCSRVLNPCYFCDTQLKMNRSKEFDVSLEEIQKITNDEYCGLMITGGEPTYDDNFDQTLSLLENINCNVINIESNGYMLKELIEKSPKDKNITFSYSPKIFTQEELEYELDNSNFLVRHNIVFKLVADPLNSYIEKFLSELVLSYPDSRNKMMIMPKGTTYYEIMSNAKHAIDMANCYKTNFSSRNHIIFNFD